MTLNPVSIRTISAIFFVFLMCPLWSNLNAQNAQGIGGAKVTNGTVVSTGPSFKYVVGRRETLYSIAKRFNVTQEEILKVNPQVKGILTKGTELLIPSASPVKPEVGISAGEYRIESGDNYYQLGKRFGITQAELEELNPSLKDGFKAGMVIKIPVKKKVEPSPSGNKVADNHLNRQTQPEPPSINTAPITPHNHLDKTFNIGVFLPFNQSISDSARIAQRTNGFLEFYSGVLLAAEKSIESGIKIKLYAYDTYQDSAEVGKLVIQPEFLSLDLIIGPVFPENQKMVAGLCAKNHIPMVSPLSSDSRFVSTTPGYYLINPGRTVRLTGTADFIAQKYADQNIILLNRGTNSIDEKYLNDRITQKIGPGKVHQYNILSEGAAGLEAFLKTDKENIFVLAEGSEADVSVAMTRLNTISKLNKITVIGLQEYTKMQSIDVEYLHNTDLHYLAPYYIDYGNPKVNTFIAKYRSAYGSEPTPYSFQGYDIALHFIASLAQSGKNFPVTNPNPGVEQLQAQYSFQKLSDFGGYINRSLYIIEYSNNYEVRCSGKIEVSITADHGLGKQSEKNGLEQ